MDDFAASVLTTSRRRGVSSTSTRSFVFYAHYNLEAVRIQGVGVYICSIGLAACFGSWSYNGFEQI
jgi:hypothetical protein